MQFFQKKLPWQSPLSVFPYLKEKNPMLFFSGTDAAPFSFVPFSPQKIWKIETKKDFETMQKDFENFSENWKLKTCPALAVDENWQLPFSGGICGAMSYDFGFLQEKISAEHQKKLAPTLGFFGLYTQFFAFDHKKNEMFLAGFFENQEQFEKIYFSFTFPVQHGMTKCEITGNIHPIFPKEKYLEKFAHCQAEIFKGNSFQINLSQCFEGETQNTPWEIFVAATKKNPAPMMFFAENFGKDSEKNCGKNCGKDFEEDFAIISCSPERLFSVNRDGKIFTQPIAGTRKRGKNLEEDDFLEAELKNSVKEMAEHSMIVDLLRNDMGKFSEFGSVKVLDFARVEKYASVMHLVSDIEGKMRKDKNVFDVFLAFFPGGTITGAPKHETMKILAREEETARGFYCGSAGYFSLCGNADFNILIRTISQKGRKMQANAGGGLVFGADDESEYAETLHKIAGIQKIFLS